MESEGKERWSWGGIVRGRERGEGGREERKRSEGGREQEQERSVGGRERIKGGK